jgi:hypothetical protein
VLALFYSDDPQIKKLMDIGVENPLDVEGNSWETIKPAVEKKVVDALTIVVNSSNPDERWNAQKALAALRELRELYGVDDILDTKPKPPMQEETSSEGDGTTKPDPRRRKVDLMRPQAPEFGVDELEPETDEERIKEAGDVPTRPFRG